MITRDEFLQVAEEGYANPRTAPYDVHPLHGGATMAYPFRTDEGVIPAAVMQFAVENRYDSRARRVISVSRSALGFAIWCGDVYTEGRLAEEMDVEELMHEALMQVPSHNAEEALEDMQAIEGSYPFYRECHFWKAWHSHRGVCKHVAAVFQWVDSNYDDALDGLLDDLEDTFAALISPQLPLDIDLGDDEAVDKRRIRGEILALVCSATAPVGGLNGAQYDVLSELLDRLAE
jgi:hypothetical protein